MKVPRRCEMCGGAVLLDEWEIYDRAICIFCQAECGEEEKEEGEYGN